MLSIVNQFHVCMQYVLLIIIYVKLIVYVLSPPDYNLSYFFIFGDRRFIFYVCRSISVLNKDSFV